MVVRLLSGAGRAVLPRVRTVPTAPAMPSLASPGWFMLVRLVMAGVYSRRQQVRNASFQGQPGLIFRTRSREAGGIEEIARGCMN